MQQPLAKTFVKLQPRKWDGGAITMPGLYYDLPIDVYHSGDVCSEPSISSSGLRTIFNQSPAHYWVSSPYNPDRVLEEETDALTLGRAAHHLLFGQEEFGKQFVMRPLTVNGEDCNRRTRHGKIWHKIQEERGLTIVTPAQVQAIQGMAQSLAEHPLVKAGILNGLIEHSLFAKDQESGLYLKARPDVIPNDSLDFADLKTTESVDYRKLVWTIRDYGYHIQAGLLNLLCRMVLKQPMASYSLVFVEKNPPWCVRVVTLKPSEIDRGERSCRAALDLFKTCWETQHWPGPGGDQHDAQYIELDGYTRDAIDERLKQEFGMKLEIR